MKAFANKLFTSSLLLAFVFSAVPAKAAAPDLAAAEAAHARNDNDAVIKLLLPAWNNGQLKDGRALFLLGTACSFQKHKLQFALNKAAQCYDRTGRIIWAAADAGNVDALLNLAYTLDTHLAPMRHRDLPQDRAKAYRAALVASRLATTDRQRESAQKAMAEIGGRLNPSAMNTVAVQVAEFLAPSGSVPDMLVLADNLRDSGQAYRWAMLAADLATDDAQRQQAQDRAFDLSQRLYERADGAWPNPAIEAAEAQARGDFFRLVKEKRSDLLPPASGIEDVAQFKSLGWLDVPNTGEQDEMSEGNQSVYGLSIRRTGDQVRFDASLSAVDTYRLAQFEGDCQSGQALLLRDTGWQGYDEEAGSPVYRKAARKRWTEGRYLPELVAFACKRAASP